MARYAHIVGHRVDTIGAQLLNIRTPEFGVQEPSSHKIADKDGNMKLIHCRVTHSLTGNCVEMLLHLQKLKHQQATLKEPILAFHKYVCFSPSLSFCEFDLKSFMHNLESHS